MQSLVQHLRVYIFQVNMFIILICSRNTVLVKTSSLVSSLAKPSSISTQITYHSDVHLILNLVPTSECSKRALQGQALEALKTMFSRHRGREVRGRSEPARHVETSSKISGGTRSFVGLMKLEWLAPSCRVKAQRQR
jgi:hypothetical protein